MAEARRRLLRELRGLNRESVFGDRVEISLVDDNAATWKATLRPEGIWEGAVFDFVLRFPDNYPDSPPRVEVMQPILHPNINAPSICFNQLERGSDGWDANTTAETFINGLLWLLYNPNFSSVLNTDAGPACYWEREVRRSLTGAIILGTRYPKFIEPEPEPNCVKGWSSGDKSPVVDIDTDVDTKRSFFQTLINNSAGHGAGLDALAATGTHFAVGRLGRREEATPRPGAAEAAGGAGAAGAGAGRDESTAYPAVSAEEAEREEGRAALASSSSALAA